VPSIDVVNQCLNIICILNKHERVTSGEPVWISGNDNSIDRDKSLAEVFYLVGIGVVGQIHQVNSLAEHTWFIPWGNLTLLQEWDSGANQILDSSIVKLLYGTISSSLILECYKGLAAILPQAIFDQVDFNDWSNNSKSSCNLVLVPISWQVVHVDLVILLTELSVLECQDGSLLALE